MTPYTKLHTLMNGYLNQDYDLICEADTIEEALDYYVSTVDVAVVQLLLS